MADVELSGVSPSYEALCRSVAASESMCALIATLPPDKQQPNLLLGAVRYLDGPAESSASFLDFVHSEWARVASIVRAHRTQTNEAGRCAVLLPLLASFAQPLALIEVGASAGLCLFPDRYSYRFLTLDGERRLGASTVELSCEVTGPAPLPSRLPRVTWRAGLDLHPLHVDRAEDRRWLSALVWPEQTERARQLAAAMELVRMDPPRLVTGDAVTDLAALVEQAPTDATVVVFHSAVLAYLSGEQRRRFADLMGELRSSRGVHWVANEAPGVVVPADPRWPVGQFVLTHDEVPVALTAPHGQRLAWFDTTE